MAVADPESILPWLPLAGQIIFVSVHRRRIDELELQKYIQTLGGKVETFFSNEITCVLTDELPQLPKKKPQTQTSSVRSSIISKAEMLGIQILQIECFLTWLHIHAGYPAKQQPRTRTLKPVATNKVTKLSKHFMKVEDTSQKYCPIYKVYPDQHKADFEDLFLKTSNFNVTKTKNSILPVREVWTNSRDLSLNVGKHFSQKETVKFSSSVLSSKPAVQRQSRKYCECCKMYFSCLEKHLKGPRHTKFLMNQDNFRPLAFLSNDVPDLSAFQRKHSKKLISSSNTGILQETCDDNDEVKLELNFVPNTTCTPLKVYEFPLSDNCEAAKNVFSYKTKDEIDFQSFLASDILPDNERLFTSDESDGDDINNNVFKLLETALQDESLNEGDFALETQKKEPNECPFLNISHKVPIHVEDKLFENSVVPNVLPNRIFMENFCLQPWSVKPISDVKMSFFRCSDIPSLDIHVNCDSPKDGNWRVKMVQDTKITFAKV